MTSTSTGRMSSSWMILWGSCELKENRRNKREREYLFEILLESLKRASMILAQMRRQWRTVAGVKRFWRWTILDTKLLMRLRQHLLYA